MLATGLRAVQVLLLAACVYFVYAAISPLVRATPIPETHLPEVPPSDANAPDRAFDRFQVIATRNLFKTRDVPQPIAGPIEEELEESKLRVKLMGTLAAEPPELSVATVVDQRKLETLSLRIGDEISGAKVERIERRRIVLDNRGKLEQISLEDDDGTPTARRQTSRPRTRAARTRTRTPRARARPTPPVRPTPTPSASIVPPGLQGIDLEPGERITAVNGIDLTDESRIQEMVDVITQEGPKTLTIVDDAGNERQMEVE